MEKSILDLAPPFSKTQALRSSTRILLPHVLRSSSHPIDPRHDTRIFLKKDLEVSKLNKIYKYLWLAGLPRPARFLHRQRLLMRTIVLTECPDEHLVWHDTSIWIKPLPEYLLDYGFWEDHLCDDEVLYKSACGLLMSYTWLIYYKSDHRIAVEMGLLPHDMNYDTWTAFTINLNLAFQVSPRYEYGELRLSRLNSLYRFGAAGFSLWNVVFGFVSRSTHYTAFFQRNFGWILAVFGYFTVLLSAMQVALATEKLGGSAAFQEFSLCIAMLSLAFVLFTVAIILFVWAFMFWFHLLSTAQYVKKTRMQRAATIGLASI